MKRVVDAGHCKRRVCRLLADSSGFAILGQGALQVTQLQCCLPRHVTGPRVVGPQPQARFEQLQCLRGIALRESDAAAQQRPVARFLQAGGDLLRALVVALGDQDVRQREEQVRRLLSRAFERLLEGFPGLPGATRAPVEEAEHLPGCARVEQLDGLLVRCLGFLGPAGLLEQVRELGAEADVIGSVLDGLAPDLDRLVTLLGLDEEIGRGLLNHAVRRILLVAVEHLFLGLLGILLTRVELGQDGAGTTGQVELALLFAGLHELEMGRLGFVEALEVHEGGDS